MTSLRTRALPLLLALLIALAVAAPMTIAQDLTEPISAEKITLTAYWPAPANVLKFITDFNEGLIWPLFEEQTNIHIEWWHGSVENFNTMISSGDLTDIIFMPNNYDYVYPGGPDKAIADGAFLRLNELMEEHAPNYFGMINSSDDYRRDAMTDTGNIYGFAMLESNIQGPYVGMVVRKDFLDELGLPMPVTYDDWYAMLKAFKEKGVEGPLMLTRDLFYWDDCLIAGFDCGKEWMQIDGQVKYGPLEPGFKEYIAWLRMLYSEGLMDKDFVTRDDLSREEMMYNGKVGAWPDGFWMLDFRRRASIEPDKFEMAAVTTPVRNVGDVAHLRQTNYHVRPEWTAISAQTKYPVEAVRWLDNLYSPQGYMWTNWGVEGVTYNLDANGDPQFTDLIVANPDGLVMAEALYQYTMHDGPQHRKWDREDAGWTEEEKACEAVWAKADSAYVLPYTTLTEEEGTINSAIMNDVKTFVQEMSIKYVIGDADIDKFDEEFTAVIKSMGIDDAIAVQQAALDRYYARK